MDTIKQFQQALTFDLELAIDRIMMNPRVRKEIIELNQKEQLSEGIDAKAQRIRTISATEQNDGNVYSHYTIFKRGADGLQTTNVDLKDSGAFWNTFKVVAVSEGWDVLADFNIHMDDIRDNFESKFDFLGLTPDNLDYFAFNIFFPELKKEIDKWLKK